MLSIKKICGYARKGLHQTLNEYILLPPINNYIVEYGFDDRDMYCLEQSMGENHNDLSWKCIYKEQRERAWSVEELAKILLCLNREPFDIPEWSCYFWSDIFFTLEEKSMKLKRERFPAYFQFECEYDIAETKEDAETPEITKFVCPKEVARIYETKTVNDFVKDINLHLENHIRITRNHPFLD